MALASVSNIFLITRKHKTCACRSLRSAGVIFRNWTLGVVLGATFEVGSSGGLVLGAIKSKVWFVGGGKDLIGFNSMAKAVDVFGTKVRLDPLPEFR